MTSLLPGYAYDIFISYRHNDNLDGTSAGAGQGWVTDFVESLEKELRSTLKDTVTIYFDKNPHNGLLETHDVDGSLKEKIKCLVFIPIISQTYCDPKAFAWRQEFLPFLEFCRTDSFGLDIKLANGNVAKRVLPIRIHEIDQADKGLFESAIGGVMRPIDFTYRAAGVNRPLRPNDARELNQNKTQYRDQINKVANTIKDLLNGLTNYEAIRSGASISPPSPPAAEVSEVREVAESIPSARKDFSTLKMAAIILATVVLTALASWKYMESKRADAAALPTRLSIVAPPGNAIELVGEATVGVGRRVIDISAAGDRVVYIGNHNGRPHIFVRDLDAFTPTVIPHTEGAYGCTLSNDAKEVAYFVGNSLRKVRIDGGTPVVLAEVANPMDILWDQDNVIYFSSDEGQNLYRYTQQAEFVRRGQFNSLSRVTGTDYLLVCSREQVGLYDLKSDSTFGLNLKGTSPRYTSSGDIVFVRGSTLMRAAVDWDQAKVIAEPREILSGVRTEVYGTAQFALAGDDTFIYIEGEDTRIGGFTWLDQTGKAEALDFPRENYGTFKLSPDETKIATPIFGATNDIWIYDLLTGKRVRLANSSDYQSPVWRDNNSLFVRGKGGTFLVSSVESTPPELILEGSFPRSVSADGQTLVVGKDNELFKLDMRTKELTQLTNRPGFGTIHGSLSPDGSLVAYTLNDSKAFHVFLQHAKKDSKAVQLSTAEGSEEPRWSGDSKRIVYRKGQQWMVVDIINPETLEVSKPTVFAEGDYINIGGFSFDLSKDGKRLLLVKGSEQKTASEIKVIKNLLE